MNTLSREFQNGDVRIQVKATDQLRHLKNGLVSIRLELAHLRHWLREPMPVIVVAYDAAIDIARWLQVQSYFANDVVRVLNLK